MYTENNVGDILQPCFKPVETGNHGVNKSLILTVHCTFSFSDCTVSSIRPVIPIFISLYHRRSLLTVSKAFLKSIKYTYIDSFESFRLLTIV